MSLSTAVSSGNVNQVQLALPSDEINARDAAGATPLFLAASLGHVAITKLLLSNGAKVNSRNRKNWTPLHAACSVADISKELLETLISAGAKLNQKNCRGRTPFMVACHAKCVPSARLLMEKGINVNEECMFGRTAIHWAIKTGDLALVQDVVKAGADLVQDDQWSKSPLFETVRCNAPSILQFLCSLEKVDLNCCDSYGRSSLHYAAINGFTECAQILLQHKVPVDVRMRNGTTPLMFAAAHAQVAMVNFLLKHGADPLLVDKSESTAIHRLLMEMKRSTTGRPWLQAMVRLIQANIPLNGVLTMRLFRVQKTPSLSLLDIAIRSNLLSVSQLLCLAGSHVHTIPVPEELVLNPDSYEWVLSYFQSPPTLKTLCRHALPPLSTDLSALPDALQKFLQFDDLLQYAKEHDGELESDDEVIAPSEDEYEPSDYDSDLYGQRTPVDSD